MGTIYHEEYCMVAKRATGCEETQFFRLELFGNKKKTTFKKPFNFPWWKISTENSVASLGN